MEVHKQGPRLNFAPETDIRYRFVKRIMLCKLFLFYECRKSFSSLIAINSQQTIVELAFCWLEGMP